MNTYVQLKLCECTCLCSAFLYVAIFFSHRDIFLIHLKNISGALLNYIAKCQALLDFRYVTVKGHSWSLPFGVNSLSGKTERVMF